MQDLRKFLDGLHRERVGLILKSGEIVELPNAASEPEDTFLVLADDLLPYIDDAVGTFHTHPKGGVDPSSDDIYGFLMWPDFEHWIVAPDGMQRYRVENGAVTKA